MAQNLLITGGLFNNFFGRNSGTGSGGSHPSSSKAKPKDAKPNNLKKKQRWEKKVLKSGDVIFKFGKETDIVIPIMGPTGTGKSTFINTLLQNDVAEVGHDFTSGTTHIQHFVIDDVPPAFRFLNGRRLVIVDTPGFDDIHISDDEVLRRISAWLAHSYANDTKIGGVIYLQDISQSRLHPSSKRNVEIFRSLCGSEALSSVVITTAKWEVLNNDEIGGRREGQLTQTLWREVIDAGALVRRYEGTHESAWRIINTILDRVENTNQASHLQIQRELVDLFRYIGETDAGKVLTQKIRSLRKIQRERTEGNEREGDGADVFEEVKLKGIEKQIAALKIPLSRRLQIFLGLA